MLNSVMTLQKVIKLINSNNFASSSVISAESDVIELDRFTGIQSLKLKPIDPAERIIKIYEVHGNCSLKEFVEGKGLIFKRYSFYYEFTHSEEFITEDQKLIFMEKVH